MKRYRRKSPAYFSLNPVILRCGFNCPNQIAGEAELVEARGGFGFLEGPVTERSGDLYFTDEPPGFSLIRLEKYVYFGNRNRVRLVQN